MKIRNLIVGMLFLFTLAGFNGLGEARRKQHHKLLPSEKESAATAQAKAKGVMLMNRIGPSASELYLANADGTNEHKLLVDSKFDYHASYSPDAKWIVFDR